MFRLCFSGLSPSAVAVIIIVGIVALVCFVALVLCVALRKRKQKQPRAGTC